MLTTRNNQEIHIMFMSTVFLKTTQSITLEMDFNRPYLWSSNELSCIKQSNEEVFLNNGINYLKIKQ